MNGFTAYGRRIKAELTDTLRTFCLHLEETPLGSYLSPKDISVSNALNNSCSIYSFVNSLAPSFKSLVSDSLETKLYFCSRRDFIEVLPLRLEGERNFLLLIYKEFYFFTKCVFIIIFRILKMLL